MATNNPVRSANNSNANTSTDSTGAMPISRTKLAQQRSAVRLDDLLDAAAQIIDEVGSARLTTARVAKRAGSSIGTLYRYFPDRIAVMRALRDREVLRFRNLVVEKLRQSTHTRISDGADHTIDAFVQMHRHEPGFRIIRFEGPDEVQEGDGPSAEDLDHDSLGHDNFDHDNIEHPGYFARQFVQILSEEFGVDGNDDDVFCMEVVVETSNALITRAFMLDPAGDTRFIDEARVIARQYLEQHFDNRGTLGSRES